MAMKRAPVARDCIWVGLDWATTPQRSAPRMQQQPDHHSTSHQGVLGWVGYLLPLSRSALAGFLLGDFFFLVTT